MPHNVSYSSTGFTASSNGSQNSLNLNVPSPASSTISSNAGPQSPFGLPRKTSFICLYSYIVQSKYLQYFIQILFTIFKVMFNNFCNKVELILIIEFCFIIN